jgi:hypothetical protein
MNDDAVTLKVRPTLDRWGPNRSAVNFYRAAVDDPHVLGGVPLDSVESAVTAAVRLGYKVAESQVERTTRFARRLRAAGDRATGGGSDKNRSDRQALDATEQLIFKALMAGLSWFEGVVADRDNPLKRLGTAQFRLLGSLLGLLPSDQPAPAGAPPPQPPPSVDDEADFPSTRAAVVRRRESYRRLPQIKHESNGRGRPVRRAIRIIEWKLTAETPAGNYHLTFYGEKSAARITGELLVDRAGSTILSLKTLAKTAPGAYRAAICDDAGVQLGYVEIAV